MTQALFYDRDFLNPMTRTFYPQLFTWILPFSHSNISLRICSTERPSKNTQYALPIYPNLPALHTLTLFFVFFLLFFFLSVSLSLLNFSWVSVSHCPLFVFSLEYKFIRARISVLFIAISIPVFRNLHGTELPVLRFINASLLTSIIIL